MSTVTYPSIGRKLWLFLDFKLSRSLQAQNLICLEDGRPFDASIAFIHPKKEGSPFDYVNVSVADHSGNMHALTVPLRQEGQSRPDAREWVEWPKFVREQASAPAPVTRSAGDLADEALIQAAGATRAPRLTPADIDSAIVGETFTVLPSGRVTVCELTLKNGFTVRGESAVVSIENFDAAIGEKVARDNARSKVWELEGYLLKQRLFEASKKGSA